MGMRIVAGKYRHLQIEQPDTLDTRPTMDKVREAIFSALGDKVVGAKCLDLFAGSGAMGLEALSRGAENCIFVDSSKIAYDCIKRNISKLRISEPTEVHLMDAREYLKTLKEGQKVDILFLDPPYKDMPIYCEMVTYLYHYNYLSEDAIIVAESDNENLLDPLEIIEHFAGFKKYKYGKTYVYIVRR